MEGKSLVRVGALRPAMTGINHQDHFGVSLSNVSIIFIRVKWTCYFYVKAKWSLDAVVQCLLDFRILQMSKTFFKKWECPSVANFMLF